MKFFSAAILSVFVAVVAAQDGLDFGGQCEWDLSIDYVLAHRVIQGGTIVGTVSPAPLCRDPLS